MHTTPVPNLLSKIFRHQIKKSLLLILHCTDKEFTPRKSCSSRKILLQSLYQTQALMKKRSTVALLSDISSYDEVDLSLSDISSNRDTVISSVTVRHQL